MVSIRITSKCNMRCDHCCFSCEPGKGEHMSMKVFNASMSLVKNSDEMFILSGGEPTMHPKWDSILGVSLIHCLSYRVHGLVVTNGTLNNKSLVLASLNGTSEYFHAELSYGDGYHDPHMVDKEVVKAFGKNTRCVSRIFPNGRALELGVFTEDESDCACSDLIIQPNGDIFTCGCEKGILIGNILNKLDFERICSLGSGYGYCTSHYTKGVKPPTQCEECRTGGLLELTEMYEDYYKFTCRNCKNETHVGKHYADDDVA